MLIRIAYVAGFGASVGGAGFGARAGVGALGGVGAPVFGVVIIGPLETAPQQLATGAQQLGATDVATAAQQPVPHELRCPQPRCRPR